MWSSIVICTGGCDLSQSLKQGSSIPHTPKSHLVYIQIPGWSHCGKKLGRGKKVYMSTLRAAQCTRASWLSSIFPLLQVVLLSLSDDYFLATIIPSKCLEMCL